jgi:hypothetical protein
MPMRPAYVLWYRFGFLLAAWSFSSAVFAQSDSLLKRVQLPEFVVSAEGDGFDLASFMRQVMNDTSFHHAFLNTRFYPHQVRSALNVRNKHERESASLFRHGRLVRTGRNAELVLDSVRESGRLRERDGEIRYLTAEMYDDVFFPKGPFPASNRIADRTLELDRSSRFEKYKSELKKFMFNPGQEIASVPFIGDKLDIFTADMALFYDYVLDTDYRDGHHCWVFTAVARDSVDGKLADADDTVIKRMVTWFDIESMNVLARDYRIAHASLFLDFDISIRVENTVVSGELVPVRVRYDGDWDIPFKKRELVRFWLEYAEWKVGG